MMPKKDKFIAKAKAKHGDKYDYSKVVYSHSHTEVTIICPKHGEFAQKPINHISRGRGCQICSSELVIQKNTTTQKEFIDRATRLHGNNYDYSKINFLNMGAKIEIICKKHGAFSMTPANHLYRKQGCPKCYRDKQSKSQLVSFDEFKNKAIAIHSDKYQYIDDSYMGMSGKISYICLKHGEIEQSVAKHLKSNIGCPKCSQEKRGRSQQTTQKEYIKKCKEAHGDRYDYSKVEYKGKYSKVKIRCIKHDYLFTQIAETHYKSGCPKCGNSISRAEDEIANMLTGVGVTIETKNKSILDNGQELDIVIPSKKIAIEYNGLRWHSEQFGKDRHYHSNKTLLAKQKGYNLIHIFEDDYVAKKSLVVSHILHLVGKGNQDKIFARKTTPKNIDKKVAIDFLEAHHIQGSVNFSFAYGLYFGNELVSVTAFKKGASNTKNKGAMELVRHATKCTVVGSLGKTLKFYHSKNKEPLYTFRDDSYFFGDSYLKAGFLEEGKIAPDYKYVIGNQREHKFKWRLKEISKKLDITGLSEREAMISKGFYRIWDCGKTKFVMSLH